MRTFWVVTFTLLAGSAGLPAREAVPATTAATNLSLRSEQPLQQYRAFRRMHTTCENGKYEAWLEAWTELRDGRFTYEIVSERGSDVARGKVLRPILAREQEMLNKGDGRKSELTADNYEFSEAGRDGDGARLVQIKPRRHDAMLVDGHAVLNDGGDLLRVEGRLSKNPSFWTSLVNIVRRYARIGGVRVPVASETTARVKFVGTAQLEMLYDYQSVNGHAVAFSEQRSTGREHIAVR
ncbi:MAG: hypothetical protein ABIQ52_17795 [Vicinamibacterales bacterium]